MNIRLQTLLVLGIMSSESAAAPSKNSVAFIAAPSNKGGVSPNSALHDSSDAASSGEVPRLPESDPNADIPTLKLGETITFEEMGPVILNMDGTTRRINNWNEMSDKEREVTWRRISKRNEERRQKMLEQLEQASGDTGDEKA